MTSRSGRTIHSASADRTERKDSRARGRKGGRPKKLGDREWHAIRTLVDARELTIMEIAGQYSVSPATIYRLLRS